MQAAPHSLLQEIVTLVTLAALTGGWLLALGVMKGRLTDHHTFIKEEWPAARAELEAQQRECVTTREFMQAMQRLDDIRGDVQTIQRRLDAWRSGTG